MEKKPGKMDNESNNILATKEDTMLIHPTSININGITIPEKGQTIHFGNCKWRVLDVQNDEALILSETVIEKRRYHYSFSSITWSTSELRNYLNNTFYNTFILQEKLLISEKRITTYNNPWFGTNGGEDTYDRIFLLSIEELVHYFGDSKQLSGRPNGAFWINDEYNSRRIAVDANHKESWWWLRSPGYLPDVATIVSTDGIVVIGNNYRTSSPDGGVRPALWLSLSPILNAL